MKIFAFLLVSLSLNVFAALPEDVQALWEKRADKAALKQALAQFEILHNRAPADREMMVYLSRGYFLLGELSLDDKKEKMKAYENSKKYGLMGLSLNPEFKKLADKNMVEAAKMIKKEDVPSAFWTAAALGRWSDLNGVMSSLKWKDPMLALITKVEELQPEYFYGAVYRFWAGFYALAPRLVGGDMKKSKEYFDKVLKMYPEYIGTKVAIAEQYHVENGDEKKFQQLLEEVVKTPLNGPKDIGPENFLEQKKAEMLLQKRKEIF